MMDNNDDQRDVDYSPSGSNRFIWSWFYNRNQAWNCMIWSTWTATTPMDYDTWQLLTVTIDNGDVTVYINGVQTFTWTMSSWTSAIIFGNDSWADRHWYGYMKDIISKKRIKEIKKVWVLCHSDFLYRLNNFFYRYYLRFLPYFSIYIALYSGLFLLCSASSLYFWLVHLIHRVLPILLSIFFQQFSHSIIVQFFIIFISIRNIKVHKYLSYL